MTEHYRGPHRPPDLNDILKPIEPESTGPTVWNKIYDNLSANPIFSGGAGLAAIGIGLSLAKRLGVVANTQLRRYCIRSLELTNENPWGLKKFYNCRNFQGLPLGDEPYQCS